jgi:hypothetical protein
MSVVLDLTPEVEARRSAQARVAKMTLEEYLLSILEGAAISITQTTLSPEQRAIAYEAWSAAHKPTPALSDHAVSRDTIYESHDH